MEMKPKERRDAIRKIFNFVHHETRLKALSEHEGLTQVLKHIMGDTPVLFQDMALVKTTNARHRKNRGIRTVHILI